MASLGIGPLGALSQPETDAHVYVQSETINPAVDAFTATYNGRVHNGVRLSPHTPGFEPVEWRTRFQARAGSANDRITLYSEESSFYKTRAENFLNGFTARVYRITNGDFGLVRSSTIIKHAASGWFTPQTLPGNVIVPQGTLTHTIYLPDWHRGGVPLYVGVAAVNAAGDRSAFASSSFTLPAAIAAGGSTGVSNVTAAKTLTEVENGTIATPTGLTITPVGDDRRWTITWDSVASADGYVVRVSQYAPGAHLGFYLDLEPGAAVLPGDLVFVEGRIKTPSRAWLSDSVWGAASEWGDLIRYAMVQTSNGNPVWPDQLPGAQWSIEDHVGTPFPECGETFGRWTVTSTGSSGARVGYYNHTRAGSTSEYATLIAGTSYTWEIWAKADSPRTVYFYPDLKTTAGANIAFSMPLALTTEWQKFTGTFTPSETWESGEGVGQMRIDFNQVGVYDFDNFRIYETAAPWHDMPPVWRTRLVDSGMAVLRLHQMAKTGRATYSLATITNPAGVGGAGYNNQTLPGILTPLADLGINPWIQIEPHFSESEWLGLLEWLVAPTGQGSAWAAKRAANGREAPWLDAFDRLYVEVGNEPWNPIMAPWTFEAMTDAATSAVYDAGTVTGKWTRFVIHTLQGSPFWTPAVAAKVRFVLGGWAGQAGWTGAISSACPEADYVTIACYNGGWDAGLPPPEMVPASYRTTINFTSQGTELYAAGLALAANGLKGGTYEAGPGYGLNGLNGATVTAEQAADQERIMKSLAAGVATLDGFLLMAAYGFAIQNFFTFDDGVRWTSHATAAEGGAAYPSWQALSLFNNYAAGLDMKRTAVVWAPRRDLPAMIGTNNTVKFAAKTNVPDLSAYAFRSGGKLALFLINRKLPFSALPIDDPLYDAEDDGFISAWVKAPLRSAASCTVYRLTGPYDAHNVVPPGTEPKAQTIVATSAVLPVPAEPGAWVVDATMGADDRGVPPNSAFLWVFEGVS